MSIIFSAECNSQKHISSALAIVIITLLCFQVGYFPADTDDCAGDPCASTGTCQDQVDGFICICDSGYDGTLCNNNIDDCTPDPCVHGSCTDGVDSFTCSCDAGYEGDSCGIGE